MKRILCVMLTILMVISLTGCTPDKPEPTPNPGNDEEYIADDFFSGEELEIFNFVREFLLNTSDGYKVMKIFDNCPHHGYMLTKENGAMHGYNWRIEKIETSEDYNVTLEYAEGFGITEEWIGIVSKDKDGYYLKAEFSTSVYEDEADNVIKEAADYVVKNKIAHDLTSQYPSMY